MKFVIHTFGCRLNKAESLTIVKNLQVAGFTLAKKCETPQIIIVNSCAVTQKAERQITRFIKKIRSQNPKAFLLVCGCWVDAKKINKSLVLSEAVDLFVSNQEKKNLVDLLRKKVKFYPNEILKQVQDNTLHQLIYEQSGRSFIKIQDGCNKFCSYCLVPYLRGRSQSVPADEVIKQIKEKVTEGIQEIIVTGVDISQYQDSQIDLVRLLQKILEETGIKRIRLGSVYPEVFTGTFLDLYKKHSIGNNHNGRLCRHFHISLQSGCNRTLRRMNRQYTVEQFIELVQKIRKAIPGVNITTDVIVGFAGETEVEFEETYKNCKTIGFGKIHIFPYSLRPGTLAAARERKKERGWEKVDERTKSLRAKKLRQLSKKLENDFKKQFRDQELEVLIENKDEQGNWVGLSDNYMRFRIKDTQLQMKDIIYLPK